MDGARSQLEELEVGRSNKACLAFARSLGDARAPAPVSAAPAPAPAKVRRVSLCTHLAPVGALALISHRIHYFAFARLLSTCPHAYLDQEKETKV